MNERELLTAYLARGDLSARDALIAHHMPFIIFMACRFGCYFFRIPKDDLIQIGVLSMMHSLSKYDLARGTKLMSYCGHLIKYAMLEAINSGTVVKRPDTIPKLQTSRACWEAAGAVTAHLSSRRVVNAHDKSLQWPSNHIRAMEAEESITHDVALLREAVDALAVTQPRLYRIVSDVLAGSNLAQIGVAMGFSRERARQLYGRALLILREQLEGKVDLAC